MNNLQFAKSYNTEALLGLCGQEKKKSDGYSYYTYSYYMYVLQITGFQQPASVLLGMIECIGMYS
jgi:hypothetical protein